MFSFLEERRRSRTAFVIALSVSLLVLACSASALPRSGVGEGAQPGSSRSWTIANKRLKIVLSGETKGGLSAFTDLQSERNFIAKAGPLYRFQLFQKGKDLVELSSLDAESVK